MSSYGSCSDDSLRELPLPYDISYAVTRALRLDSVGGTELAVPASECPPNLLTVNDGWNASKAFNPGFCAVTHTFGYVDVSDLALETIQLDMAVHQIQTGDVDILEQQGNLEQLDEFCKYIGNEEEEGLLPFPSPAPNRRPYSISDCSPVATRANRQPRKKRRRTEEYHSSPEAVSPDGAYSPTAPSAAGRFNPHPPPQCYNWKVSLVNSDLWESFDQIGTEMVITKNGRRMFPALSVHVKALDPEAVYSVTLYMRPADNKRYKFLGTEWVPVGRAEKKQVYREYVHPDSPNLGSVWMEKPVAFKFVKLTNNKNTRYDEQVILNSMQKYQPFFRITSERDGVTQSYSFPETQFIAVTAYQNSKITQLKVENNPYARAFRDGNSTEGSDNCGGHCSKKLTSTSSAGSPEATPRRVRKARVATIIPDEVTSSSMVRVATIIPDEVTSSSMDTASTSAPEVSPHRSSENDCTSAISVESGFESGDCYNSDIYLPESQPVIVDDFCPMPPQEGAYGCCLGYWTDNTLYNPALITSPPMLDSSSSFSEPYLLESCRVAMETTQYSPSPVKGFHLEYSDTDTSLDNTLVIDVVHYDDDDVFL